MDNKTFKRALDALAWVIKLPVGDQVLVVLQTSSQPHALHDILLAALCFPNPHLQGQARFRDNRKKTMPGCGPAIPLRAALIPQTTSVVGELPLQLT